MISGGVGKAWECLTETLLCNVPSDEIAASVLPQDDTRSEKIIVMIQDAKPGAETPRCTDVQMLAHSCKC